MKTPAKAVTTASASPSNAVGIFWAMGAALGFTMNDVAIKWLSGTYPLHEITFLRGIVAVAFTLSVVVPLESAYRNLRPRRVGFHLLRALIVIVANMAFYAGLASLPLGEATAIYFVAPLFITLLSVFYLGERVGPRRWLAIVAGLAGVYLVIRPGSSTFQLAALLPLLAALAYASLQITTRKLGVTEKASTLAFYLQLNFVIFSGVMGLVVGNGRFGDTGSANLDFLLNGWAWPAPRDGFIILGLGVIVSIAGYLVAQAYRSAEAGLIAPFEYVAMPLAVVFGVILWGDWPDAISWSGILMIVGSGVYVFYRETELGRRTAWRKPLPRVK